MTELDDADATEPANTELPEHPTTRHDKYFIAGIAAVALVISGIINIATSAHIANSTNQAFDQRTQRDFLHTQKITAYSRFLGHLSQVVYLQNSASSDIATAPTVASRIMKQYYPAIGTDVESIRLLDPNVYTKANEVFNDVDHVNSYLVADASCSNRYHKGAVTTCHEEKGKLDNATYALFDAINDFSKLARASIQS